jgi:hypothetical protein
MSRNTATFAFLGYAFVTGITFSSIFWPLVQYFNN